MIPSQLLPIPTLQLAKVITQLPHLPTPAPTPSLQPQVAYLEQQLRPSLQQLVQAVGRPFALMVFWTVQTVQKRAAELLNWPLHQCEALQIQRYLPGDQYKPHYDYFQPGADDFEQIVSRSGQRIATLIMYLNTPEQGGDTYFWNLGIKIKARKGSALFFSYPDANTRSGTFHGGDMVMAGEKWIATQWLRTSPVPVSASVSAAVAP